MTRRTWLVCLALGAVSCGGTQAQSGPTIPPPGASPPVESAAAAAAKAAPPRPPATSDPDTPKGAAAARDAELAAKVAPFVDAFVNSSGQLTPDGKKLVFTTSRDGLSQLYVADAAHPEAAPTRLTETPERTGAFTVTTDGKWVVFETDKGADENWTIWKIGLDGKNVTELTPGETMQRDPIHLADRVPGTIYYSARKKEEATSVVYALALAGGQPPKKLYAADGLGLLADVAPDGKSFLFVRAPALSEEHLFVVDAATGAAREVYPGAANKVALDNAHFSADGKRVLVVTDTGAEKAIVLALDVKTGKEVGRYEDTSSPIAAVGDCVVPRKRARLACAVTIGDHNAVRILDAASLK